MLELAKYRKNKILRKDLKKLIDIFKCAGADLKPYRKYKSAEKCLLVIQDELLKVTSEFNRVMEEK